MKVRYVGTYPQALPALGLSLKTGDEFEVADPALASDLVRREGIFEEVTADADEPVRTRG